MPHTEAERLSPRLVLHTMTCAIALVASLLVEVAEATDTVTGTWKTTLQQVALVKEGMDRLRHAQQSIREMFVTPEGVLVIRITDSPDAPLPIQMRVGIKRDVRVYLNAGVYKKEHGKWAGTAVQEPGGMVVVANRPKSCTATLPQRALLYGNHFDEARRVVGWLERTLPCAERYAKGGLTLQKTSVKYSGGANYGTMMSYDRTIPEPPTEGEGLLAYEDFAENNAALMALDYVDWSGDRSYDKVALRILKETTWLTPLWWYQILASEDPLVRDSYALFRTSKTGDYVFNNGRMRVFAAKLHEGDEAGRWAKRFMQPGVTLFDDTCFGEIVSDFEDFKKTPEVAAHGALICNITQMRVVPDDDATITVFPAIPTEWERPGVAFCNLAAKGAILVSDMSKKSERERNRGDGHWRQAGRTTHKSTNP